MTWIAGFKLAAAIAIGLALAFLANDIRATYAERERLAEENVGLKATATTTAAVITALDQHQAAAIDQTRDVTDNRARQDRAYQGLKREDQTVASWAATPIPARLLEQEREDRANRPANHSIGSEGADGAARASGADKVTR